jgi:hypothetical protein
MIQKGLHESYNPNETILVINSTCQFPVSRMFLIPEQFLLLLLPYTTPTTAPQNHQPQQVYNQPSSPTVIPIHNLPQPVYIIRNPCIQQIISRLNLQSPFPCDPGKQTRE